MIIETVRVSQKAKDQLTQLKRVTGIQHWNVLCRWALCTSLADPTPPPNIPIKTDSSIEMDWKTFSGEYADIYIALLKERCINEGVETNKEYLQFQFKLHLNRGIGYLASNPLFSRKYSFLSLL